MQEKKYQAIIVYVNSSCNIAHLQTLHRSAQSREFVLVSTDHVYDDATLLRLK